MMTTGVNKREINPVMRYVIMMVPTSPALNNAIITDPMNPQKNAKIL